MLCVSSGLPVAVCAQEPQEREGESFSFSLSLSVGFDTTKCAGSRRRGGGRGVVCSSAHTRKKKREERGIGLDLVLRPRRREKKRRAGGRGGEKRGEGVRPRLVFFLSSLPSTYQKIVPFPTLSPYVVSCWLCCLSFPPPPVPRHVLSPPPPPLPVLFLSPTETPVCVQYYIFSLSSLSLSRHHDGIRSNRKGGGRRGLGLIVPDAAGGQSLIKKKGESTYVQRQMVSVTNTRGGGRQINETVASNYVLCTRSCLLSSISWDCGWVKAVNYPLTSCPKVTACVCVTKGGKLQKRRH